jgi:hypothetical protein
MQSDTLGLTGISIEGDGGLSPPCSETLDSLSGRIIVESMRSKGDSVAIMTSAKLSIRRYLVKQNDTVGRKDTLFQGAVDTAYSRTDAFSTLTSDASILVERDSLIDAIGRSSPGRIGSDPPKAAVLAYLNSGFPFFKYWNIKESDTTSIPVGNLVLRGWRSQLAELFATYPVPTLHTYEIVMARDYGLVSFASRKPMRYCIYNYHSVKITR